MKTRFDLEEIDRDIVAGHSAEARRKLTLLVDKKVPRESRLPMARLARRAHAHTLALRLLNPIVRPKGKALGNATDSEKAEYAASLTFVGASEEALALLKEINPNQSPEALLFAAFADFAQWNYADAIPVLHEYVASKKITDYQRLVGKVNLAASLVYEQSLAEANALLEELLKATESDYKLLHGNCLEMAAQNAIHEKNFKKATQLITKCEALLSSRVGLDRMDVLKWKAILEFVQDPKSATALKSLRHVRNDALSQGYWEAARDCDRYEAIYRRDESLFKYVFFGSPYPAFRMRLIEDFDFRGTVPSSYTWNLDKKRPIGSFHLFTASDSISGKQLKVGQALHRLFIALSSDFYRPLRVAVAHEKLFEGEYFNPLTSPPRVYEIVRRLRSWLQKSKVPLQIEEKGGFYRLVSLAPYSIQISAESPTRRKSVAHLLRERWASQSFTCKEAASFLKISPTSMRRLLDPLIQEGILSRSGQTTSVRYSFSK